jgi:hypothetical protein
MEESLKTASEPVLGYLNEKSDVQHDGIEKKLKGLFIEVEKQAELVANLHEDLKGILQSGSPQGEECAKCAEDPTNWSPVEGTLAALLVQMERNRAALTDLNSRIRL